MANSQHAHTFTNEENSSRRPLTMLRSWIAKGWAINWPLTLSVILNLALLPIVIVAAFIDPRIITGMPAWIKPLKFLLSTSIYMVTFLWLLTFVSGRKRLVRWLGLLTSIGFLVENVAIIVQVIRGTTSHFNYATTFDTVVFALMGNFVVLIAILNLLLGIWLIIQRIPDPVIAWSVRLGVLISFVGMTSGFLMTSQTTAAQQARMDAGEPMISAGAHSVGVEDGGPGLPLVGWSTEGGDLRVGHFIGLHAMQVLPLLGWLLTRPVMRNRYSPRRRSVLIWFGGFFYLGLTILTLWQALRGQSVIAPDSLTLMTLAALLIITTIGVWTTLWRSSTRGPIPAQAIS